MPETITDPNQPDVVALVEAGLQELKGSQKAFNEAHIKALAELRETTKKEIEEKAAKGYDSPETKAQIRNLEAAISRMEADLLRPDGGRRNEPQVKSAGSQLEDNEAFQKWKEGGFQTSEYQKGMRFPLKGSAFPDAAEYGQKAIITTGDLAAGTAAVVERQRQTGMIMIPRIELRLRDIMRVKTLTAGNVVDYLKQNVFTNGASPQVEGSAKAESTLTYTTATATVRTIAHWMQVTRQALDDMPGLRSDIDSILMYGLKLVEERQILAGDGTGVSLNGIITQATAYDTGFNVGSDTKLDKLRHFILQSRLALYPVDGIVLNPRDMHDIELLKDGDVANFGRYILGDPRTGPDVLFVWGKPVVESDAITAGQALVGAFRTGAELFDRQMATVDISFEHGTNFTENEATIRCEERLALAVTRPGSFIYGAI